MRDWGTKWVAIKKHAVAEDRTAKGSANQWYKKEEHGELLSSKKRNVITTYKECSCLDSV